MKMGWTDWFKTKDPESGKSTDAKVKVDKEGHVSDMIYNKNKDSQGGKHGHVWGLNSYKDKDIGGRDSKK
jgi:hypothetical protein